METKNEMTLISCSSFIKIVDGEGKCFARANKMQKGGWNLKLPGLPYRMVCEDEAQQAMVSLCVAVAVL